MSLNCRKGDLAIVVKSVCGNEGKIVRCLEFAGIVEGISWVHGDLWLIDREMLVVGRFTGKKKGFFKYIPDSYLRPIRDQKGEDEMLRIAGKPVKETANG